jgi:transposase-like protein
MVAESFAPGASVSKVAQRYGVNANLLFTWRRRDARSATSGVEAVELLPVRVEDERVPATRSLAVAWRSCREMGL